MNNKKNNALIPLLSILLGVVIGGILLILTGKNPVVLFTSLLKGLIGFDMKAGNFFQMKSIGELFVYSMPLILTGLSIGFAYRTGLFNIGAEGQVIMGSLFSVLVATQLKLPMFIHLPLALLAGAIGGALWALIPGILKAYFNIIEVVVGIMLNYTAMYVSNSVVQGMEGYKNLKTPAIEATANLRVDWLTQLFGNSRFHLGIIVVVIALVAYWFIIEKTTYGYNLRATGYNREGAEYAGLKVNRNIVSSMVISGVFAGLAGALLTLGTFGYTSNMSSFLNYGYDGIAVALVGNLSAIGIGFAGILFGLLKASTTILQLNGIPEEIAEIIAALIVFFVASQKLLIMVREKMNARKKDKEKHATSSEEVVV